jgi:hypothetical protein
MPFGDIVDLFEYWADYPPLHLMVRNYLGYESRASMSNPAAMMEAMKLLGSGRAQKLSEAPEIDRQRFEALKEQANRGRQHAKSRD